jgi:hypothetical protein
VGLAEGGLLADVGVVLDLASIYLPIVGTVLEPAIPTPFVILTLRRGPRATLLAGAVAMFLVTVIAGPHFGWRMGLRALVGLLIGVMMKRRMRAPLVLAAGTLLVTLAAFAATFAVILFAGLPAHDIVDELRNGLNSGAWVLATGASLLGWEGDWLTVRPILVGAGLFALRFWPLLLFLYLAALAAPIVTLYFAVANGVARVLGYDVRPFPPRWFMSMLRLLLLVVFAPIIYPRRALRWLFGGRKRSAVAKAARP